MTSTPTKHVKRARAGRPITSTPPHQLDTPEHTPLRNPKRTGKHAGTVRPNRKALLTPEEHSALVAAYQSFPGQHQRSAQATGIPVSTCRRLWEKGHSHPSAPWARTPIQELVRERAEAARADLQLHREAAEKGMAQALGRLDALRARADKAHELADHVTQTRALRGTICELTAVVGEAVARLSDGLPKVLADTLTPERVVEMAERDPEKPFRLLRGLGKTVQELTAMSESVIKLERLLMGETTEHKGHTVQIEGPAEAVAIIERAARAAARAGGGATAIPGRPGPTKALPPS